MTACGVWMPKAQAPCALGAGHKRRDHQTAATVKKWERARRRRTGGLRPLSKISISTAPLHAYVRHFRIDVPWKKGSHLDRSFWRPSIQLDRADEFAVLLGVNPTAIWGDDFFADLDIEAAA